MQLSIGDMQCPLCWQHIDLSHYGIYAPVDRRVFVFGGRLFFVGGSCCKDLASWI